MHYPYPLLPLLIDTITPQTNGAILQLHRLIGSHYIELHLSDIAAIVFSSYDVTQALGMKE